MGVFWWHTQAEFVVSPKKSVMWKRRICAFARRLIALSPSLDLCVLFFHMCGVYTRTSGRMHKCERAKGNAVYILCSSGTVNQNNNKKVFHMHARTNTHTFRLLYIHIHINIHYVFTFTLETSNSYSSKTYVCSVFRHCLHRVVWLGGYRIIKYSVPIELLL